MEEDDKESQGCGIVFFLVAYKGQKGYCTHSCTQGERNATSFADKIRIQELRRRLLSLHVTMRIQSYN